jgi:hypothetical protein
MTFSSVQFGSNNQIVNDDIADHVHPNNVLPDSQKAHVGIVVKTPQLARFNTGSDQPATQGSSTLRVQLNQPTDLVKVLGTEAKPDVVENLKKMQPELFVEPAAKQAQAKQVEEDAKAEELSREELNTHPGEIEGYHRHLVGEVNPQHLISLMVYGQRGEAPPSGLIENIARDMHVSVDEAAMKINAVSMGTSAQFTVLAKSMGLDATKAQAWIADHRKDSAMAVAQAHLLRRDLMAWKPLLEDYRRATGDGVAR